MLHLYHSNRLEILAERFIELTRREPAPPMVPESVVTQNRGMARWLTHRLALGSGIAANLDFDFPASFIWQVLQSQLANLPEQSGFERETLVWRIFAILPDLLDQPAFAPLANYLATGKEQLKRYQLARRIADSFDQYTVYRPQWIMEWERGEGSHWQSQLWRALVAGQRPTHRARLFERFAARQREEGLARNNLPTRVSFFAVAALPPSYLDVLTRIAEVIDVHLFLLNPSVAYWGDIVAERDAARLREALLRHGRNDGTRHFTVGNPLLASLGKQGREFQHILYEAGVADDESLFQSPGSETLLQVLQADILLLQHRGRDPNNPAAQRLNIRQEDRSLQIHACHSPMREIEVLHDQLLALFDANPELAPGDVVVMAPDIDRYAPFIEAVFGGVPRARHIPWAIADRSPQLAHPLVRLGLELLDLPFSRFGVDEVLALLEIPAVMRRFRLDGESLARIRTWVVESGVRWGLDANSRAELDLPATAAATWRAGLERLLLGYAMPEEGGIVGDIVAYSDIEGLEVDTLGQLTSFIERLAQFRRELAAPRPAAEWLTLFNRIFDDLLTLEETEQFAVQLLRDTLDGLASHAVAAGFKGEIGVEVVRDYLRGHLAEMGGWQQFLTGQITFCTMVPMRSIPFPVVGLIGMGDREFPRNQTPLGFDLIAQQPRVGDRSRREDDRYLFLEALLSAREHLYISYVGRDIRDNSPMLPSVVVAELLDAIDEGFAVDTGSTRNHVVTEHPLQPFSSRYLAGRSGLFTYASEWHDATGAGYAERRFLATPLPEDATGSSIELGQLIEFFRNPVAYFLKRRLNVRWPGELDILEESEPFTVNNLNRFLIGQALTKARLEGRDTKELYREFAASARLPFGHLGEFAFDDEVGKAVAFADLLRPELEEERERLEFTHHSPSGLTLTGWVDGVGVNGRFHYRYGQLRADDRVALWLTHLALNTLGDRDGGRNCSHLATPAESWRLAAVADAPRILNELLALYHRGQQEPLPFNPDISFDYVNLLRKGTSSEEAVRKAADTLGKVDQRHPEWRIAFDGEPESCAARLAELAEQFWNDALGAEQ